MPSELVSNRSSHAPRQPWHAFFLWILFFLSGLLYSTSFPHTYLFWSCFHVLSYIALGWAWTKARAWLLLTFLMLSFSLGGLSPPLAQKRQQRTLRSSAPKLLSKRLLFEGVLLQPLSPRVLPPYRYPLPKRPSHRRDGTCTHTTQQDSPLPTGYLGSAPFLLQRFAPHPQGPWTPIDEKIMLKVVGRLSLARGQRLRLHLKLRPPRRYANPGQPNPWKTYKAQGIRYQASVKAQQVVPLAQAKTSTHLAWLDRGRKAAKAWIKTQAKAPEARALFLALLLGDRSEITPRLRKDFAKTGTSHLLAISGLHLALVGGCFFWFWSWLLSQSTLLLLFTNPRRWAALFTLPPAYLYAFLSGPSTSTQRALLMLTFSLLATLSSRKHAGGMGLFLAACLILLGDPEALTTPSFLLSFGSVFWLMTLGSRLRPSRALPKTFFSKILRLFLLGLLLPLLASFLVMVATSPVSLTFSPYFPLHGPLINLIAIPLCGFLCVGLGLLSLFCAVVFPSAASRLFFLAEQSALWLIAWIRWGASQTRPLLELPPLHFHETLSLIMALLAIVALYRYRRISYLLGSTALFVLLLPKLSTSLHAHNHPTLQIDFLDVGQGDATLIRFPNGKSMLVDAGGEAFAPVDVGERAILPYFRHQRISKLDYAVLSHPHPDHFGGFLTLFQRLPVGEFWGTGQDGGHPHHQILRKYLQQKRIPQRTFRRPTTHYVGEVKIEILHPFPGPHEGSTYYWALHANDNSLVMLLTYKKIRILLTGDIEERAEEIMTERYPTLRADVLKVPHHGSRTSSTARFLDLIQPRHALFGIGRHNLFGFPHRSTYERYQRRGIRIWRTDQHGLIRMRTDGHQISIQTPHPLR